MSCHERRQESCCRLLKNKKIIKGKLAFHVSILAKQFSSGELSENIVFNEDETHVVIHLHTIQTLERLSATQMKYAGFLKGDKGMKVLIMLGRGRDCTMGFAFTVFKNSNCSFLIQGLEDNILGVSKRFGSKGWMNSALFTDWLNEDGILKPLACGSISVLCGDNFRAPKLTEHVKVTLKGRFKELRVFPECTTNLVQHADSFVIQSLRVELRARLYCKVMDMISNEIWTDPRTGSGRLHNLGKNKFLQIAADAGRIIGNQRDSEGVLFTCKAMIRCGMSINFNTDCGKSDSYSLSFKKS